MQTKVCENVFAEVKNVTVHARKPYGAMVSSTDQTQQAPFMFFLIIHFAIIWVKTDVTSYAIVFYTGIRGGL